MRSPIRYFGGKGLMVKKLLPYIPPHRQYVEVFGGGASLLFAKEPAKVETYNDIDQNVVNFFRVLREPKKFVQFYHFVCLTPYSRVEWKNAKDKLKEEKNDIKRAYYFFVIQRQSFGGLGTGGWGFNFKASRRGMARQTSAWLSIMEILPKIAERLMMVQIECSDFRNILTSHDDKDAFFYLDPPYLPKTRRAAGYANELTQEDHEDLVKVLSNIKGKVMLSGYPNELYDSLGWHKKCWQTVCAAVGRTRGTNILGKGSATKKQPRVDCVWMNYDIVKEHPLFSRLDNKKEER